MVTTKKPTVPPELAIAKRGRRRALNACKASHDLMARLEAENAVRLPYPSWEEVKAALAIVLKENGR